MNIKIFEFKAKVEDLEKYEKKLLTLNPLYVGLDYQVDTYFNANHGRLKLREGNIENSLINYDREDLLGAKESKIILYKHEPAISLKEILIKQLGVKIIVDKARKIYFIDNVKFHFDTVKDLGTFIEVEAIDDNDKFTIDELKQQCESYFDFFELDIKNTMDKSYSDLMLD
jgi:predicted adenylyl cyclase CyaB